jgi:hypothetical protein
MKPRVFISKPDEGWSEFEIPEEFRKYTYDKLVVKVHNLLHETAYKGLLITENPMPFFLVEPPLLSAPASQKMEFNK